MRANRTRNAAVAAVVFAALATVAHAAEIPDPEAYIKKNGFQSRRMGDDGVTPFFTFTERKTAAEVEEVARAVAPLPKAVPVFQVCDQMRGNVKAKLIADRGVAIDVAATNYGYSGSTIACVLKYMQGNQVGTQLVFMKKSAGGMYMLFVTH